MGYSQAFLEEKLRSIRECMNRPPSPEASADKSEKAASAAMLRAERLARESEERQRKKAEAEKVKAEKAAKKAPRPRRLAGETFCGSENVNTRPVKKVKVKKADNHFNGDELMDPPLHDGLRRTKEKVFATRPLNLEQKKKVQVDHKTWVYVDAGADDEVVKAKYRDRLKPASSAKATGDKGKKDDEGDDLAPGYQF